MGGQQAFVANSSAELVAELQKLGATKFGEAANNNALTLDQSLSNLKGTVYQTTISFMEGLAPSLKITADNMAELIRHNETFIRHLGVGAGEALRVAAAGFQMLGENIDVLRNALLTMIGVRLFGNLQGILARTGQILGQFGGVARVAASLTTFAVALGALKGPLIVLGTLLTTATLLLNIFEDTSMTLGGTVTSVGETFSAFIYTVERGFGMLIDLAIMLNDKLGISDFISEKLGSSMKYLFGALKTIINFAIAGFVSLGKIVLGLGSDLILAWRLIFGTIAGVIYEFITRAGKQFTEFWNFVSSGGTDSIENAFSGMGDSIGGFIAENIARIKQEYSSLDDISSVFDVDYLAEAGAVASDVLGAMVRDFRETQQAAEDLNNLEVSVTAQRRPQASGAGTGGGGGGGRALPGLSDIQQFYQNIAEEAQQWEEYARDLDAQRASSLYALLEIQGQVYGEEYQAKNRLLEQEAALLEALRLKMITTEEYQKLLLGLQENFRLETGAGTFAEGWSKAFEDFKMQVEDSAAFAQTMFDTLTSGLTDALVTFAETGKLSFRGLMQDMMREIFRMMANKIVMNFLGMMGLGGTGAGGGGGFLSSLFGGARAEGGPVMANKTYLVGEQGPELFRPNGTGSILPNDALGTGGSQTTVNYNINAVDARSFRDMVARDPEFIYAVSRAGARRVPG